MRIAVLACGAIKDEVEKVIGDDPDFVQREYLDFGLHIHPSELRLKIEEKLRELEGRYDAVFLGYAHCQCLKGIPARVKVPTIMLETEDCIAAFLTPQGYQAQKKSGGITWFYPTGWAKDGVAGMVRLFNLDSAKDSGYEPEYFLHLMFDGFSRCLFIDTGAGDIPVSERHSEELADLLHLKHERCHGTLAHIEEAVRRTKELATQSTFASKLPSAETQEATS
jgi:hypothetical protein